jgi:hypothetical protein
MISHSIGLLVPFIQQQARETLAARIAVDVGGEAPEVLRQVMMTATMVITPTGSDYYPVGRLVADTARCPDRDWLSLPENVRRACRQFPGRLHGPLCLPGAG